MGRPVATVAAIPISTVVAPGARTTNAARPPVSTALATGRPLPTAPLLDGQASIADIEARAKLTPQKMSMRKWVRNLFPWTSESRPSYHANASLVDGEIRMWDLYTVAARWDALGLTTPSEFVEAVSCETRGHPRGEAVLAYLGRGESLNGSF